MKKIFISFPILLIVLFLSACNQSLNKEGITLNITEEKLNESFKESFPFKKDFNFGNLSLKNPKIKMHKELNRIQADLDFGLKTIFTGTIKGAFSISGEPLFKQENSSIYLKNVILEDFNFGRLKISDEFSTTFKTALQDMINEVLKTYPIYRISKDSIQGSFVKSIKINDSKLLITYGI